MNLDEAVDAIAQIVSSTEYSPGIRYRAIEALGSIGNHSSIDLLHELFLLDADYYARELSVRSVVKLSNKRGIEIFLPIALGSVEWQRAIIARAFSQLTDPEIIPDLLNLLTDPNPAARSFAASHLYKFNDARKINPLLDAISDVDWQVRVFAVSGLINVPSSSNRIVNAIINALNDDHAEVIKSALFALGEIGDPRAVKPLIELLALSSEFGEDIIYALEKINTPEALKAVETWRLINLVDNT